MEIRSDAPSGPNCRISRTAGISCCTSISSNVSASVNPVDRASSGGNGRSNAVSCTPAVVDADASSNASNISDEGRWTANAISYKRSSRSQLASRDGVWSKCANTARISLAFLMPSCSKRRRTRSSHGAGRFFIQAPSTRERTAVRESTTAFRILVRSKS